MKIIDSRHVDANCLSVVKVTRYEVDVLAEACNVLPQVGIDPGTKYLGFAYMNGVYCVAYQIELVRQDKAIQRMIDAQNVLEWLNCEERFLSHYQLHGVIEGASFGDRYRQTELAEQRATMAMWLKDRGVRVELQSPLTIRKNAFGSAKIKASDEYAPMEKDAAVALSIVIGALTKQ